jgi:gliding motility-associated-like protein
VEGDWVNNATFIQGTSTVEMYASTVQQLITGTVSTTFHNLTLTGTGTGANRIKKQTIDASIDATGILNINDRELATDVNSMFVLNPSLTAVDNDSVWGSEGFVSSLSPGVLSRVTTSGSYNFPVGSSLITTRYRPIRVEPNTTTGSTYTVRFVNHDANIDGFNRGTNDSLICNANPLWYHAILRPAGNDPADIRVYYDVPSDQSWSGMSHWRTAQPYWWDMNTVNNGNTALFTTMTRGNWQFATAGDPYILTDKKPAAPTITCPTICANGTGTFTVVGNGTSYSWTTPNGTTIVSGQGTDTLVVNWGNITGPVIVTANSLQNCASLPDTCYPTISPAPIAGFDTSSVGNFQTLYQFADTSTGGTTWFWDFGDGSTSNIENPSHQYQGAGTYTVMQIVTNAAGCVDTIFSTVVVGEGILIPNVFTPDGDGINDEFYIPSSGFESFSIEVFNRWGTKIWEANSGQIRWDGHSTSGQMMSDGTYYFVLDAILKSQAGNKTYKQAGFVELLATKHK